MAAAVTQDLPPKGGYAPINFTRIPARSYFSGYQLFAGFGLMTAASCYLYYRTYHKISDTTLVHCNIALAVATLVHCNIALAVTTLVHCNIALAVATLVHCNIALAVATLVHCNIALAVTTLVHCNIALAVATLVHCNIALAVATLVHCNIALAVTTLVHCNIALAVATLVHCNIALAVATLEDIEMHSGRLALQPMLYAERDREFLKQVRRNRDEEAKLMANVEGWEVGTYHGQPIYKTLPANTYREPNTPEYYVHGPTRKYVDSALFALFT
ncbi:NADH dehydrogenase [ubiquinone] 1 alpha subcomplex subunit 13 [Chionoecetes opilio]|uniref:NADH dehydrogenase [ubiquinone] 1 alpha subcomplex subunit 13 n=1 Tax=Chionoecetes opilio TaxID=41210 RepID=A0A8J5CWY2_CHIOP|nr:NADH dehydrogenase [ubiquinone] 1 alpha subcomplex subunit 13 [Chionoecetes opilio]